MEILLVYFLNSRNVHLVHRSLHIQTGTLTLWCGVLRKLNNIQAFPLDVCHFDWVAMGARATSQSGRSI
jgi:hypothetical protein